MGGEQSVPYRGAKRARDDEAMEEALELLRIQSHDELSRVHVRHLSFKPTWTKLAEFASRNYRQRFSHSPRTAIYTM